MRRSVPLLAALLALVLSGCPEDYTQLYNTEPLAPSLTEDAVQSLDWMGPYVIDEGVNFCVWSSSATRIDLVLFDDPEVGQATQQFEMTRFGDVWNLYVEGVGLGQHYGYVAWGPNWPVHEDWFPGSIHGFASDVDEYGNRFNPNKLLMDPYAKAVHRDHDWSKGSAASGPGRTQSTWAAGAKSVVTESNYSWSDGEAAWRESRKSDDFDGHRPNEMIVYEVHPKGYTADPSSAVDHPGTFRGVGEKADYFSDLGVNAVEFLPVHEKPLDGGYWGYNNLNFFAPEISYAADPDPRELIDEFKWMVDQLHQQGVEVWIDVVYNHTGEGGLWRERIYQNDFSVDPGTDSDSYDFDPEETAGLFSYRGLDNAGWYALDDEGAGYWNNTGVGNQTRPNHTPMRRLTMDSLRFYVEEMHVDGFRFDLAPILGEVDLDYNNWDDPANTVLQDIIDADFIQSNNVRIVAEPWSAGGYYNPVLGGFPAASNGDDAHWGEWNARFRDWWRSFVNEDQWGLNWAEGEVDGGAVMTGTHSLYAWNERPPAASYNFVTVHDGFTMFDLMSYWEKQNGCGPLNPVCCDDPTSSWCEAASGEDHNRSRDWGSHPEGEALKRQMMRNLFAGMMISHGTPMLLGGDEWMRTQHGNNNAYSTLADNEFNWFQWGSWQSGDERVRMHDFVRDIIRVRKDHYYAFAPSTWEQSASSFAWWGPSGDPDWTSRAIAQLYEAPDGGPELFVIINMERGPVDFTLPPGRTWTKLIDTQRWFDFENPDSDQDFFESTGADTRVSHNSNLDDPETITGATYSAADSSIVILEAAQ
jgi:isoamylase